MKNGVEIVEYNDKVVRQFIWSTFIYGLVGMLVGVIIAFQLAYHPFNGTQYAQYFSFGRLRPLHTDAMIFAFAGNGMFAAIYYSTQRLLKTRMFSNLMSNIHFWGWQFIIAAVAISYPLGITQGKEYAEMEWPIDLAITVIWVVFAVNFFMTLVKRREKHIYVAIWFYIATIVTVAVLHIVNNLVIPVTLTKSYPVFSGVQDALVQWWYGHNAVAFVLTTPFLGMMYYFLPKAANRPVFSYRLSILHFWSLVFVYIWAGPHHLHYTALPEWASTLGMVFSVVLWMPSWGGMINGLFTLRGAWDRLRDDVVLKFFVIGITFYGMSTFEGPLLSIKSVNALSHYTDWTIAHVHSGTLGWNAFMVFGMTYYLIPKLWKTKIYSPKLSAIHFWIGLIGILLYIIPMYSAGITQGLMWRAYDETGRLMYPDFMETVVELMPMYWARAIGGTLFLLATIIGCFNMFMSILSAPKDLRDEKVEVATPTWRKQKSSTQNYDEILNDLELDKQGWHRILEGWPIVFSVLTTIAILIGSVIEIAPFLLIKESIPRLEQVKPFTPLELEGRDIYIKEGCYTCHSQMIRALQFDVDRYGPYSRPGESIYSHPFQWGSKRTGPDLAREGGLRPHYWHVRHMEDPRSVTANSIMPAYPHMLTNPLDLTTTRDKIDVMLMLNVPYPKWVSNDPAAYAREQAKEIAAEIEAQGGPEGLEEKEIIAIVAYLQRLGVDFGKGDKK